MGRGPLPRPSRRTVKRSVILVCDKGVSKAGVRPGKVVMRIWAFSCLQLDHPSRDGRPWMPEAVPDADVAVVSGDLFPPLARSVEALIPIATRMPVVYVPGNRDYYARKTMVDAEAEATALARRKGIHLLLDDVVILDGTRFVGGTLWTDYALQGDAERGLAVAMRGMSDHSLVDERDGLPFTPQAALARHRRARLAIAGALASEHSGPTVVISHHAPHPNSVQDRFRNSTLTPAFVSDLSPLLAGPSAPDLWLHGAVHANFDYSVGRTRVLCNSRGYPGENPAFDPTLVVEVGRRAS